MERRLFKPFGELGIKLITNLLSFIKSIPKRRIVFLLVLSALFTSLTVYLFSGFFDYLLFNSVTLSSLNFALVDIIGHSKYQTISNFIRNFSKVFIVLTFVFYSWLFYRGEKKKQYLINLKKIMEETSYMAEGNL
jgi:small-conductance mechanosensitive channel